MVELAVERAAQLSDAQIAQVRDLVARVTEAEAGVRPVSDRTLLHLRGGGEPGVEHLLVRGSDGLVGYGHLERDGDGAVAEVAGLEPEPLSALLDTVLADGGEEVAIWAHGDSTLASRVMRQRGLQVTRTLLQMRRSLAGELPEPELPAGDTVRTFVVGQDEPAWLEVNNAAFARHPEQSGWTVADVTAREHEPWFDPGGFFLAERDGELVGFHWTKVHDAAPPDGEPIGEVYVVGVAPSVQGLRLGGALTLIGLRHLQGLGLPAVMLYADESNTSAVRLYERLGFAKWDADVVFSV